MLWIFERKGEQMRCEIRREGAGAGFEMIVTTADGSQRMERFDETNEPHQAHARSAARAARDRLAATQP